MRFWPLFVAGKKSAKLLTLIHSSSMNIITSNSHSIIQSLLSQLVTSLQVLYFLSPRITLILSARPLRLKNVLPIACMTALTLFLTFHPTYKSETPPISVIFAVVCLGSVSFMRSSVEGTVECIEKIKKLIEDVTAKREGKKNK